MQNDGTIPANNDFKGNPQEFHRMPKGTLAVTPQDPTIDRASMGMRLRAVRKAHGLTLKALSAQTGVALSTLSKMELGQVSIGYEKFAAVARALKVDIGELFGAPGSAAGAPTPTAVHSVMAGTPSYRGSTYEYRLLAGDFPARRMTPMFGRIHARSESEFEDYVRHEGQEFIIVLSGKVRLQFVTGEVLELAKHDSAYFDSSVGHMYLSLSRAPAEIMVVMAE